MKLARSVAILLVLGCGSDDPPPPTGPIAMTVTHYDYAFDVASRAAAVAVTMTVDTGGDCLSLPTRIASAREVTLGDEPALSAEIAGGALAVCGLGWDAGTELTLRLSTDVPDETWENTQVGYSTRVDLEGQPFHYLVSWVGGCDRFGPCDNAPDRFATYRFTVNHPSGFLALCPGRVTAGDTETTCEFELAGGPTYSTFGAAASPSWVTRDLGDWNGVRATLYDHPSSEIADNFDAAYHQAFLAWMVDHFGPYPYGNELRFFVGPTHWNGFEHPGNIALSDQLVGQTSAYTDPLGHTVNHELAHMWAGDQTTLAGTYDFVWKEAMAEYLSMVFDEEERDPAVGLASASAWKGFSRFAAFHPVPGDEPELLDYYGDVYGQGPMVLFRQLESLYARDDVFAALAMLLGSPRAIGVADVKTALESTLGVDLTAYFDAWVYGEGAPVWPTYRVTVTETSPGNVDVTVTQTNVATSGVRGSAFTIELYGATAGEAHEVRIDLGVDGAETLTVSAAPGFAVTRWALDRYAQTLALEDRTGAAPAPQPRRYNPWVADR